jgi:hypothetical protein
MLTGTIPLTAITSLNREDEQAPQQRKGADANFVLTVGFWSA